MACTKVRLFVKLTYTKNQILIEEHIRSLNHEERNQEPRRSRHSIRNGWSLCSEAKGFRA